MSCNITSLCFALVVVVAQGCGSVPGEGECDPCERPCCTYDQATGATVDPFCPGPTYECRGPLLDAGMGGPGSIAGVLINAATDEPINAATVTLLPGGRTATTDAFGAYRFVDVAAGRYTLGAIAGDAPCVLTSDDRAIEVVSGATATADLAVPDPGGVTVRTLVVNLDPIIEAEGGRPLHEVMGWNDPHVLTEGYRADLEYCSHNFVHHEIVDWIDADEIPALQDGFRYDDAGYLAVARREATPHMPDGVDYLRLIADYRMVERVDAGEIDEILVWGAPWFGFYESQMAGPGAYWVNSPGLPSVPSSRLFVVMGLNYERGVAEAIHSFGHRTESILAHVYGGWSSASPSTAWDYFAAFDGQLSGNSGCGNVHFPPNGAADYDYSNTRIVSSRCEDYLASWPALTGGLTDVSVETWAVSGDDARDYLRWWYWHIPAAAGTGADGLRNSWWAYVAGFNDYPESR